MAARFSALDIFARLSVIIALINPPIGMQRQTAMVRLQAPLLRRARAWAAVMVAAVTLLTAPGARAQPSIPEGVWLIDNKAAIQIYDCAGLMCGRILWMITPRNPEGQLDLDKHNPDPALRQRPLCGLTMIWGLQPDGPGQWRDGWFYNPHDGTTYRISARQQSADVITARVYLGLPLFGETKTLARVAHGVSAGWC